VPTTALAERDLGIARQPKTARQPVAGSRRDDAEGRRGADHRTGSIVDGAVAAPDDDAIDAARNRGRSQLARVARAFRQRDLGLGRSLGEHALRNGHA
jgi:hypothetical protein